MRIPGDLLYTKEHEWVKKEGNVVALGITDHAQEQLGDVVFLELPEVEDEVSQDDTIGSVESTKAVSDIFTPVSGKVVEINEDILDSPEVVNQDPYGQGWMVKIELSSPDELDDLLSAEDYEKFVAEQDE